MSTGWSIFISVIVIGNIIGVMWLLFATSSKKGDSEGWVEFSARFIAQGDDKSCFHRELSHFIKEDDHWFYVDGEPRETGRNEICPCGSGKKFKRCCQQ